ncbi:diguanylate cyclase domain-containing protein [Photobacterium leiognathi subsp. mandapamensis]
MRDTDTAIRWGGEEFVIILPKMKCNKDLIHKRVSI